MKYCLPYTAPHKIYLAIGIVGTILALVYGNPRIAYSTEESVVPSMIGFGLMLIFPTIMLALRCYMSFTLRLTLAITVTSVIVYLASKAIIPAIVLDYDTAAPFTTLGGLITIWMLAYIWGFEKQMVARVLAGARVRV